VSVNTRLLARDRRGISFKLGHDRGDVHEPNQRQSPLSSKSGQQARRAAGAY